MNKEVATVRLHLPILMCYFFILTKELSSTAFVLLLVLLLLRGRANARKVSYSNSSRCLTYPHELSVHII